MGKHSVSQLTELNTKKTREIVNLILTSVDLTQFSSNGPEHRT